MANTNETKETVTIVGYVDPIDSKKKDSGIVISTGEDEILVEPNKKGRQLIDLIGEEVQVTGTVTQTKSGTKQISISSFNVLEYEETGEDYTYYDDEYDEMDRFDY